MSQLLVTGFYKPVRFSLVARSLGAILAASLLLVSPARALDVPTDCLPDSDGANDAAAGKDVTQFCIDQGDNAPYELNVIANFDFTTINGGGTADVCMLFNTDIDAFANFAICVTIDGDGTGDATALQEVRLYTCTDTKADRCSGPTLVVGPYTTTCEVTQPDTDPFPGPAPGPGESYPADTQILCGFDLDDFVSIVDPVPIDICSYSGTNPNSNPADCISFQTCTEDSECDDANACTIDTCGLTDVCKFTPDPGTVCDDGQYCNGEEECNELGLCGEGTGGPVDCDDGVSCTLDTCDELGDVCQNDPMNSLCSDGEFCTGVEICEPLNDCVDGTVPDCSDGFACTTDTCDEANDTCDHAGNDAACDNGDYCDGDETCDELQGCLPGTNVECDDTIECTTDTCDEEEDECAYAPNHALCDDDLYCSGEESCVVGLGCAVGPAVDCEDAFECTDDSCNEETNSCDHAPVDADCSNGDFCDGEETCNPSTGCQDGLEPNCSDGVPCTDDTCDEENDECDHATDDLACDDDEYCNGVETCDAVNDCQDGTPVDCNDDVDCTLDSCYEIADTCMHSPSAAACDNDLYCDGEETCDMLLGCQDGDDPECEDAFGCTEDTCNEMTDSCDFTPNNALCTDGNFCSGVEICDALTGCETGSNPCPDLECDEEDNICVGCLSDNDCDNDDACDGLETCLDDACVPGTPMDCDDGFECTADSCSGDTCVNAPNDGDCSDGLYCSGVETCNPTTGCEPGIAVECDDDVDCTIDSCDEMTDGCLYTADDTVCDNDLYCDGEETCDTEEDCVGGTPPDCTDDVDCTFDSCNEDNDECSFAPADTSCSNGQPCDGVEICDPLLDCQPAAEPLDCDDGFECTADSCDIMIGCLNIPNDLTCDDGVYCDGVEVCNVQSGCEEGIPIDCADQVDCTTDACSEDTETCSHISNDVACDNMLYCDGIETCDQVSGCEAGTPPNCADQVICTGDSCNEDTDQCVHDAGQCICGDSQIFGAEECDPPAPAGTYEDCNDNLDNDSDGRIDCRDQDCKPGARLPICDETCTNDQVCARFIRDPARITYGTVFGPDELYIHGRIPMSGEKLRSVVHAVTFELSNPFGPIYRASLDEGDMRGGIAGKRYRFRDSQARYLGDRSARGGLEKVSVRTRRFNGEKFLVFTIRAYGDFSKARHRIMTTELSVGTEVGYLTMEWKATPQGWILHQKNFAGEEIAAFEE